ncbi:hypothetical protein CPB85DRAFT_1443977 [Mucidula mucida]|nr:hypothetical protein CPB85DRAFT_1443977 [Mucidula mucida]
MSISKGHSNRLKRYPHCPDDEVRELFYRVRDVSSTPIYHTVAQSEGLAGILSRTLNDVFKCSWPDIIKDDALLDLPAAVKSRARIFYAAYLRAQENSALYEFYHVSLPVNWDLDTSLRQFRVALCSTIDLESALKQHCGGEQSTTEDYTPALAWSLAYDSLMLNVWHNELQEKGVSISFRPRWSSFPSTAAPTNLEFPVIIPDVVFSARIDTSYPRLQEALKYHPAYVFSCGAAHPAYIDIPILVIEYKKRYSENNDSRGNEDHRKHLRAAMTAALPLYSVLGIEAPLCGLFLKHYGVDTLMGIVGDSPAEGRTPYIHKAVINEKANYQKEFDLFSEARDLLHLRTIISKIYASAKSISAELEKSQTKALLPCDWADEVLRLAAESSFTNPRRLIDVTRPPSVVDDEVLRFLFDSSEDEIRLWLQTADIVIESVTTSTQLPAHIKLWLCLFEEEPLYQSILQEGADDIKKGLPDRAHDLLSELQNACTSGVPSGTSAYHAYIRSDVTFSLLFCSYARDLCAMPEDPMNNHSRLTHWMAFYNCLFSKAYRSSLSENLLVRYYPHWTVHRLLRKDEDLQSDGIGLTEIRPHFALVFELEDGRELFLRTPDRATVKKALRECSVATRKGSDIQITVAIVEYVLTIDNPQERAKHLAHLSAALRSALALWELFHVEAAILGFLVEQNIVLTVVAWINKDKKCIISEISDYTFNMSIPHETFRFFNLFRMQGSETFVAHIEDEVEMKKQEALDALRPPLPTQRSAELTRRVKEDKPERQDPRGWSEDVAKSTAVQGDATM